MVLSKVLSFGEGKELRRSQALVPEINALEPAMQQRSDAELRQLTDIFRKRLPDKEQPMLGLRSIAAKIFGTTNDRKVAKYSGRVDEINALEAETAALSDADLRARTDAFRAQLQDGKTLDDILPAAFATVREAAQRTLGQRHFDVQLVGGVALHNGHIAEMKTGEGKTLTSTLPAYLNALGGEGVHIVTVNDYLAKRDAEWMGVIHRFLGLEVGVILATMQPQERRPAYDADITHGTNNEFGFDYLRDNMAVFTEDLVQRGHA